MMIYSLKTASNRKKILFFKIIITVTIEGLAHAPNARIPPAVHVHNPGFRDFCAPIYAHAQ
jgi:hypothetical protein